MNGYVNGLPLNSAVSRGRYAERKVHRRPAQGVTALMDPARLAILVACFLATFVAYVERVGFSIAYTVMAKEAAVSDAVKGTVLSAFFWGYGLSQVPGGWAAQRWGGRITLSASFALWSTASGLTPGDARRTTAVAAARVCVGIAQGFLIPAVHTVLAQALGLKPEDSMSQAIPAAERAKAVSVTTSGMYLGSAGAMYFLPSLATRLGAHSLTRLNGALGFLWLLAWTLVARRMPARQNAAMPVTTADYSKVNKGRGSRTPWLRMLKHPAVWAIVVNNFTFHYAFYVVMNWLPTYFDHVLRANLADLGPIKTLPYLIMFAMSNVGNACGDWLITSRKWSVAAARKAVNTTGFLGATAALMLMPMASTVGTGVAATSVALGFLGCARGGFSVNHMDIAPKYAGVLMGISNTAGTLAGVIGVAVSGWLLQRAGGAANLAGWYNALGTASVLALGGSVVFLRFARGTRTFGDEGD